MFNFREKSKSILLLIIASGFLALPEVGFAGFASTGGKRKAAVKCYYYYGKVPLQLTLYTDGYYQAFEPLTGPKPANHIDVSAPFYFKKNGDTYLFSYTSKVHAFDLILKDRDANDVMHGTWSDSKIPGADGDSLSVTCQLADDFDDSMVFSEE